MAKTGRELIEDAYDDPRALEIAQQIRAAQAARLLLEEQSLTYAKEIQLHARNRVFKIITDPKHGRMFDDRHNNPEVNICNRVIAVATKGNPVDHDALFRDVLSRGGFYEQYHGVSQARLEDSLFEEQGDDFRLRQGRTGGWILGESMGNLVRPDKGFAQDADPVVGGDGHFYIPEDSAHPSITAPLPDESLVYPEARTTYEEIRTNLGCALWVADICATLRRNGFASIAEDRVYALALEINRLQNRSVPLKYAVAAIAEVTALEDDQGNKICTFPHPLINSASIFFHTSRQHAPGERLGIQRSKPLPVDLPEGKKGNLLVNWHITAQRLQRTPTPPHVILPPVDSEQDRKE